MFLIFLDDGRYQEGSLEAHLEKEKRQMMTTDHWDSERNICDAVQTAREGAHDVNVPAVIYDDTIGRIIDRVAPSEPEWMTDDEYATKHCGKWCPRCKSDQTEADTPEVENPIMTQQASCMDCGAEWTDRYHLDGYSTD